QDTSSVIIHKDPRIDLLVKKQIQINEETSREARRVGRGYRLLVINTNKRDEAVAAKSKVYTFFPELKSYLIYQSPYFKLKVGNFKDRKEAEEYRERLQKYFPKGVFIMNDTIEIRLDKDKETEVVTRG
ncbi:MAG TPA: SPOR domain-containing protein, partial [Chitinophagaceae bacterium]|nr:SPOR domain-containing protein [Chitinophagaceae bacterium]